MYLDFNWERGSLSVEKLIYILPCRWRAETIVRGKTRTTAVISTQPVSLFTCQATEHRPIKQFTKEFSTGKNQGVLMGEKDKCLCDLKIVLMRLKDWITFQIAQGVLLSLCLIGQSSAIVTCSGKNLQLALVRVCGTDNSKFLSFITFSGWSSQSSS